LYLLLLGGPKSKVLHATAADGIPKSIKISGSNYQTMFLDPEVKQRMQKNFHSDDGCRKETTRKIRAP
jgi:hypothetical protein